MRIGKAFALQHLPIHHVFHLKIRGSQNVYHALNVKWEQYTADASIFDTEPFIRECFSII